MRAATLEKRVAVLEKTVGELMSRFEKLAPQKDWRSTVGMFANDPVMKQIIEEGRRVREADRRKGKR